MFGGGHLTRGARSGGSQKYRIIVVSGTYAFFLLLLRDGRRGAPHQAKRFLLSRYSQNLRFLIRHQYDRAKSLGTSAVFDLCHYRGGVFPNFQCACLRLDVGCGRFAYFTCSTSSSRRAFGAHGDMANTGLRKIYYKASCASLPILFAS